MSGYDRLVHVISGYVMLYKVKSALPGVVRLSQVRSCKVT